MPHDQFKHVESENKCNLKVKFQEMLFLNMSTRSQTSKLGYTVTVLELFHKWSRMVVVSNLTRLILTQSKR